METLEPRVLLAAAWTSETVVYDQMTAADGALVGHASVAIDKAGVAHLGYVDQYDDPVAGLQTRVRYAYWTGTAWDRQTVDVAGGASATLALDGSGQPRMAYVTTGGEVRYASWNGSSWDVQTVALLASGPVDLVLAKSGDPRIAYVTAAGQLKFATLKNASWTLATVDSGVTGGLSLALDAGDKPRLSYVAGQSLKYAALTGSTWTTQVADTSAAGLGGGFNALAMVAGVPYIAYDGPGGHTLVYAWLSGSTWTEQTIDAPGATADQGTVAQVSLAIDGSGSPHVVYLAGSGAAATATKYAAWNGTAWQAETLDANLPSLTDAGPALVLASTSVQVAYWGPDQGHVALRYDRLDLTPANTPLISVFGNGQPILDGSHAASALNGTDFGSLVQGSTPPQQTFTVANPGTADLRPGALTLPAGFALVEPLSGTIAPGAADTFTIALNTLTPGSFAGDISFATNAAGMNPFNFRVAAVVTRAPNQPPSFVKGPDVVLPEDSPAQVVVGWATAISPGPVFESSQTVAFQVANDNNPLFAVQPAIAPNGTLTFTPVPNANGVALVTVTLKDSGGTRNGGVDTSPPQTFTITLSAVNDMPVVQSQTANVAVSGSIPLALVASDVETPAAALVYTITMAPGHGVLTLTGQGLYRYDAAPGFVGLDRFTFTVTDTGDPAGTHAGPGDLTSLPATVYILVGAASHLVSGKTFIFFDGNNRKVTVSLSGPGTADVLFAHAAPCDAAMVFLSGTSATSALSIATPTGVTTALGGLYVAGPMGRVSAKSTQLHGDATVEGTVGSLTLDDVTGATILIGGTPTAKTAATLKLDRVADARLVSGMPIASLAAGEWLDTGPTPSEILAPRLGTLTIGGSLGGPAGDFAANLTLSGQGVTPLLKTLGAASIRGSVGVHTWDITGKVGTVKIGGTVGAPGQPWALQDAGSVASLTLGDTAAATVTVSADIGSLVAKRWLEGAVQAAGIGSLSVPGVAATRTAPAIPGDFGAGLALSGSGLPAFRKTLGTATIKGNVPGTVWHLTGVAGTVTLKGTVGTVGTPWQLTGAVTIGTLALGDVTNADVAVSGALGAVKAIRWLDGSIQATKAASIAATGAATAKPPVAGDFAADVTLTGAGVTGTAKTLGSASIAGSVGANVWDLTGPVGTLAIKGTVGTVAGPWLVTGAASIGTLTLGDVANADVAIGGGLGAVKAIRWLDGSIQAVRATSIATTGLATAKPPVAGDFAVDVTLTGAGVTGTAKTLGSASIAGSVGANVWDLTGPVGTLAIKGTVGTVAGPWQLIHATTLTGLTLGDVTSAVASIVGDCGAVKAKRWLDGAIRAAKITSIAATGVAATKTVPAISGDFGADVTLTNASAKPALATLSVAGWLDGATIDSAGSLGTLTVGGLRSSTVIAGDLTGTLATQMALGSLAVKGIAAETALVLGSSISAWNLGTVTLRDVKMSNGSTAFGVTGHTLGTYTRYAGKTIAKKATNLTGLLAAPVDADTDFSVTLV
jgi:hypothetical protein